MACEAGPPCFRGAFAALWSGLDAFIDPYSENCRGAKICGYVSFALDAQHEPAWRAFRDRLSLLSSKFRGEEALGMVTL